MPSDRRVTCQVCRKHEREVGPISWRGRCYRCGHTRMNENHDELRTKRGPFARHWAYQLADAVWGMPAQEAPPRP